MIRVFRGTDIDYTTNGEKIIKPISAIITKNEEEEYLELEAPLEYAEFLIQDNIIVVDTLAGKKGYRIHNPVISNTVSVKAWLCYQEKIVHPADRGVVISHGKNLAYCEIDENWDNVVTKLIPVGYKGATLPEGFISVPSPYQKVYERTIEFDLSEELEEQVEQLEQQVSDNQSLVASFENTVTVLTNKLPVYDATIADLQGQIAQLQRRLNELKSKPNPSEAEKKEIATIEATIPLLQGDIDDLTTAKSDTQAALEQAQVELTAAQQSLDASSTALETLIITDLREQAQAYLDVNKFPQINYDLEAHLEGIVEVGDIVRVKHPDMRVDLLTNVIEYRLDCLTLKFVEVQFGTRKITLKSKFNEIEEKVDKVKKDTGKINQAITKYSSEYRRDDRELLSIFMSEIYGARNGIYGLLEKNMSVFRQTAAEISATVSRMNADLSEDIASLTIRADQIQSTVQHNFTTLDDRITQNESKITQTATEIRSEVNARFTNYSTTQQMNSVISQTASQIRSEVSTAINGVTQNISVVEQTANKINWLVKSGTSSSNFTLTDRTISLISQSLNINAYVTFTNLANAGQTTINGGNITTGTIDASRVSVINLNANNITSGYLSADRISGGILDCNRITVRNLSADSITSGGLEVGFIRMNDRACFGQGSYSNALNIGGTTYRWIEIVEVGASQFLVYSNSIRLGSGGSTNRIGFFGSSGTSKVTVNTLSSSANLTSTIAKVNELINALKGYGLV